MMTERLKHVIAVLAMNFPSISVIGTGYVGLCTAVGFASRGFNVLASTHDSEKAELINHGVAPFYEPGLKEDLRKAVGKRNLRCVVGREEAVTSTDITFLAVGTPSQNDGSIDLQLIERSACEIGEAIRKKGEYHLVVVKSTVVPCTSEKKVKPLVERHSSKHCGVDFGLCMSPEFLREGSALEDTFFPDRLVIGEHDKRSGDVLEGLYRAFHGEKMPPVLRTNLTTAEFIKYASNAFLATKISFINTIANICEETPGADVTVIAKGLGLDKRIGPLFLNAGLGYGGSCFPKDVKALVSYSRTLGYHPGLLETVEDINETQPLKTVQLCKRLLGDLKGKRVAILGLSFKPDTDDMREARSVPVINGLLREGAAVIAYDPAATRMARTVFGDDIHYAPSATECLRNADCCILVTEWDEFRKLQPEDFIRNMHQPVLIDGRRVFDAEDFKKRLTFAAIGLGK